MILSSTKQLLIAILARTSSNGIVLHSYHQCCWKMKLYVIQSTREHEFSIRAKSN